MSRIQRMAVLGLVLLLPLAGACSKSESSYVTQLTPTVNIYGTITYTIFRSGLHYVRAYPGGQAPGPSNWLVTASFAESSISYPYGIPVEINQTVYLFAFFDNNGDTGFDGMPDDTTDDNICSDPIVVGTDVINNVDLFPVIGQNYPNCPP
jgi:hypothetical protein